MSDIDNDKPKHLTLHLRASLPIYVLSIKPELKPQIGTH